MFIFFSRGHACHTNPKRQRGRELPSNPSLALRVSMQNGMLVRSMRDFAVARPGQRQRLALPSHPAGRWVPLNNGHSIDP